MARHDLEDEPWEERDMENPFQLDARAEPLQELLLDESSNLKHGREIATKPLDRIEWPRHEKRKVFSTKQPYSDTQSAFILALKALSATMNGVARPNTSENEYGHSFRANSFRAKGLC